jgi:hypothetical protein
VDASTIENGCIEVVPGSHLKVIPVDDRTNCLDSDWVEEALWIPVELVPGKFPIVTCRSTKLCEDIPIKMN